MISYTLSASDLSLTPGITNKTTGEVVAELTPSASSDRPELAAVMQTLSNQLSKLYGALPPRTALVVLTGHSDPRRMAALNARKSAFEATLRSGKGTEELGTESRWTSADGRALEEEVERAKRGLLFLGIKDAE